MADGLSTISTENLTAAVTSLLQKPLPDSHVIPLRPAASHGTTKQEQQVFSTLPQISEPGQTLPSVTASLVSDSSRTPAPGAPAGIIPVQSVSHPVYLNGSQGVTASENSVQFLSQSKPAAVQGHLLNSQSELQSASKLKFSVENLHLATSQPVNPNSAIEAALLSPTRANKIIGQTLQELNTPGSVQISASLLQNLLNGLTNNHVPTTNAATLLGSAGAVPDNPTTNFHQMSPTQPIQNLIQSLFPQETSNGHATVATDTLTQVGLGGIETNVIPTSFSQHLQQKRAGESQCDTQKQSVTLPEELPTSSYTPLVPVPHLPIDGATQGVTGINRLPQAPVELRQPQVQQLPFLLQSSSPGGPLQLVPLTPGMDLSIIQHLLQQGLAKTAVPVVSSAPPTSSQPPAPPPISHTPVLTSHPVHIQPKPPTLNLQTLLAASGTVNNAVSGPSATGPDLNLLHTLLSSPVVTKDMEPSVSKPASQFQLPSGVDLTQDMALLGAQSEPPTCSSASGSKLTYLASTEQSQPDIQVTSLYPITTTSATIEGQGHEQQLLGDDSTLSIEENQGSAHLLERTGGGDGEMVQPHHDQADLLDQSDISVTMEMTAEGIGDHELRSQTDPYVFCVDCNKTLKTSCQVHSTDYVHVYDTPIMSRARASLPTCLYLHQTSSASFKDFLGVWCKETVQERTKFGPVVGRTERVQTLDHQQQVRGFNPFKVSCEGEETTVLEVGEEEVCNWMMFLRPAHSLMEQNCVLYQDGEEFYVLTKTEVKEEEELLYWFSADMCQDMGISQNPGNLKLHQCGVCGLVFTTRKYQTAHLKVVHPDRYKCNWSCPLCKKKFGSNSKLNTHMMSHMGVKPHACSFCGKLFSDPSNLKTHMHIHTGEKKFKCDECGKTFRQKAHLDVHLITHTGDRRYKCSYCDKLFGRQSDLKTHTYRHTQERTYTCNTCGKVFYKTQNYKKHLKVHTGERNYMCNKCFKGFQTKYHRDRHLKICKEKNGKESSYMSLEEVAKLDNTCDAVPLKTVKGDEGPPDQTLSDGEVQSHSYYS